MRTHVEVRLKRFDVTVLEATGYGDVEIWLEPENMRHDAVATLRADAISLLPQPSLLQELTSVTPYILKFIPPRQVSTASSISICWKADASSVQERVLKPARPILIESVFSLIGSSLGRAQLLAPPSSPNSIVSKQPYPERLTRTGASLRLRVQFLQHIGE